MTELCENCGVYSIVCIPNGYMYIGSSINIASRWRHHRASLNRGDHKNIFLQRAWNKYGQKAFGFTILEICQSDNRVSRELYWMKKLNPIFNLSVVDPKKDRFTWSKETRQRMSESAKGHHNGIGVKRSGETRKKLSAVLIGNQNAKGHKHTDEERRKMSDAWKRKPRGYKVGHCPSGETRRKLKIAATGKVASISTRQKRSTNQPLRKLVTEEVLSIRERALNGESQLVIANEFGIEQSTVSSIKTGRTWRWLWAAK